MKLFLSWSGSQSHAIAKEFRGWIPMILQHVDPYISSSDINKGSRWATDIAGELEASHFGIIFITPDNTEAPWVMFEAGALTKSVTKSAVVPMLFDVAPADLRDSPLLQFQMAQFSKDEIRKLVDSINAASGDRALEDVTLSPLFEKLWPDLSDKVEKAVSKSKKTAAKAKEPSAEQEQDILRASVEEALVNTRNILKTMAGYEQMLVERAGTNQPISRLERNAFELAVKTAGQITVLAKKVQSAILFADSDGDTAISALEEIDPSVDQLVKLSAEHEAHIGRLKNRVIHAKE
jgi:hypothetical protein